MQQREQIHHSLSSPLSDASSSNWALLHDSFDDSSSQQTPAAAAASAVDSNNSNVDNGAHRLHLFTMHQQHESSTTDRGSISNPNGLVMTNAEDAAAATSSMLFHNSFHTRQEEEDTAGEPSAASWELTSQLVGATLSAVDGLGALTLSGDNNNNDNNNNNNNNNHLALVPQYYQQHQHELIGALPFAPEQLAALTVSSLSDFYQQQPPSSVSPTASLDLDFHRHYGGPDDVNDNDSTISGSTSNGVGGDPTRMQAAARVTSATSDEEATAEDSFVPSFGAHTAAKKTAERDETKINHNKKNEKSKTPPSKIQQPQQQKQAPPTQVSQHDRPIPFNPLQLLPDLNVPPPNFLDQGEDPHKLHLDLPWNPLDSSMGLVELLSNVETGRQQEHSATTQGGGDVATAASSGVPLLASSTPPPASSSSSASSSTVVLQQLQVVHQRAVAAAAASSIGVIGDQTPSSSSSASKAQGNDNSSSSSSNSRKIPDIFAPAEDLKRLLMSPLTKEPLAMMVHRLGNSILCEGGLVSPHGVKSAKEARKRSLLSKLLYYSVLGITNHNDNKEDDGGDESVGAAGPPTVLQQHGHPARTAAKNERGKQNATSTTTALTHSATTTTATTTTTKTNAKGSTAKPRQLPHQSPPIHSGTHFKRSLKWELDDLSVMLGVNVPILENSETKERLTVQIHDAEAPIDRLEALEYWLDNVFANVPRVAICYHKEGVVQGYQIVSTDKLPELATTTTSGGSGDDDADSEGKKNQADGFATNNSNSSKNNNNKTSSSGNNNNSGSGSKRNSFEPLAVRQHTRRVLKWLKDSCTRPSGSYVLVKDQRDNALKLYDISEFHAHLSSGGNNNSTSTSTTPHARPSHHRPSASAAGSPPNNTAVSGGGGDGVLVSRSAPKSTPSHQQEATADATPLMLTTADDCTPPLSHAWHGRFRPFTCSQKYSNNSNNTNSASHPSNSSSDLAANNNTGTSSPFSMFAYPLAVMCYRMAQCLHAADAEGHRLRLKCIALLGDAADIFDCAMTAPMATRDQKKDPSSQQQEQQQQLLPGHDKITWGMLDVLYMLAAAHVQCVEYYVSSCPLPDADDCAMDHARRALEALYRISLTLKRCDSRIRNQHLQRNGEGNKKNKDAGEEKEEQDSINELPDVYRQEAQRLSLQTLKSLVSMSLRFSSFFTSSSSSLSSSSCEPTPRGSEAKDSNKNQGNAMNRSSSSSASAPSSSSCWKSAIEPLLLAQRGLLLFKDELPSGLLTANPATTTEAEESRADRAPDDSSNHQNHNNTFSNSHSKNKNAVRCEVLATIAALECIMGDFFALQLQTLNACLEQEGRPKDPQEQEHEDVKKTTPREELRQKLQEVCRLVELSTRNYKPATMKEKGSSSTNKAKRKQQRQQEDENDDDEDDDLFDSVPDHMNIIDTLLPFSIDPQAIFDRGGLCYTRAINHTLQISPLEAATRQQQAHTSSSGTNNASPQNSSSSSIHEEVNMMRCKLGGLHSHLSTALSRQLQNAKQQQQQQQQQHPDEKEILEQCAQHYLSAQRYFRDTTSASSSSSSTWATSGGSNQAAAALTNFCLMGVNAAKTLMRLAELSFSGDKFIMAPEERRHIGRAVQALQETLVAAVVVTAPDKKNTTTTHDTSSSSSSSSSSIIAVVENTLAAICLGGANRSVSSFLHRAALELGHQEEEQQQQQRGRLIDLIEGIHSDFFASAIRLFKKSKNLPMEYKALKLSADFFSFLFSLGHDGDGDGVLAEGISCLVTPSAAMIPPATIATTTTVVSSDAKLTRERALSVLTKVRKLLSQPSSSPEKRNSSLVATTTMLRRSITRYRQVLVDLPPNFLPSLLPPQQQQQQGAADNVIVFTPLDLQASIILRLCDLHAQLQSTLAEHRTMLHKDDDNDEFPTTAATSSVSPPLKMMMMSAEEEEGDVDKSSEKIITVLMHNACPIVRAVAAEAEVGLLQQQQISHDSGGRKKKSKKKGTTKTTHSQEQGEEEEGVKLRQGTTASARVSGNDNKLLAFRLGVTSRFIEHWNKALLSLAQSMKKTFPHLTQQQQQYQAASLTVREKEATASYALLKDTVSLCLKAKLAASSASSSSSASIGGLNDDTCDGDDEVTSEQQQQLSRKKKLVEVAGAFEHVAQSASHFFTNRKATSK